MSLNAQPRAIAKNAASGYLTLGLGALLGVVLTPLLLSRLGTEGFGVWSLILGTSAYVALLDAGLSFATITRIAALESSGVDAMNKVISTAFILFLCIGAAGLVATAILVGVFPLLFDVPDHLVGETRMAVLIMGLYQAVSFGTVVFTASLLGTGRMYLVNLSGFAVSALASVAQAGVLLAGGGLRAVALVQLVGALATVLVFRHQVRRTLPEVSVRCGFDRATAKNLLSLGWRNAIYGVTSVLAFGSDVVLVGLLVDAKAAAAYAIALRGYTLLQRIATGALAAIGPAHAHAAHNSADARRFELYCLATYITLCLAICGALTVGVFAFPLLELWLGDVPDGTSSILMILCAVLILQAPGMNAASLMLSSERAGQLVRITVTTAALNITASIAFTVGFGNVGPALGSLLAVGLVDAIFLPLVVCRLLGRQYGEFLRGAVLPLGVPLLLLVGALALGRGFVSEGPLVLLVASIACTAFLGALWSVPSGQRVRALIRREEPVLR
jgi:O-antigen/teichoic acid export membrane protein